MASPHGSEAPDAAADDAAVAAITAAVTDITVAVAADAAAAVAPAAPAAVVDGASGTDTDGGDTAANDTAAAACVTAPEEGATEAGSTADVVTSTATAAPAAAADGATTDVTGGGVDDVPLLVRVLGANPVTATTIFACLNMADANILRQLHPLVAAAVAAVPGDDPVTPVANVVKWRAALPAAVGALLGWQVLANPLPAAALAGITHLHLHGCNYVTDRLLRRLPPSLRVLNARWCDNLSERASFGHLTALVVLDCRGTKVVNKRTDGLPASLQELNISVARSGLSAGASLAHLTQLRVLHASGSALGDATLASLPPTLVELHVALCRNLTAAASFAHLLALHTLDVRSTDISDASLASMPPSLVILFVSTCTKLTPAAVLPSLPALRRLTVRETYVGDALVASLPGGLVELHLVCCPRVTSAATLGHVCALRVLHSVCTALDPAVLAACRARGCFAPAAGTMSGNTGIVTSLARLASGWLTSGDDAGVVALRGMAADGGATVFNTSSGVTALAPLLDGRRLAVGVSRHESSGCVEVWEIDCTPPTRRATVDVVTRVNALVVLADGRLAAGCEDGKVRIVNCDEGAGTVVAVLPGQPSATTALTVLPGGALASGSNDRLVRVWDVGALACVATLAGHTSPVRSLAMLADGRLASGAEDGTVRLWQVGGATCVAVLAGHSNTVRALVALPDGRLASASEDHTILLWDTRPTVPATSSCAAGDVPMVVLGQLGASVHDLLLLPRESGNQLACAPGGYRGESYLLNVPPPTVY